jgi:hypothetical protein
VATTEENSQDDFAELTELEQLAKSKNIIQNKISELTEENYRLGKRIKLDETHLLNINSRIFLSGESYQRARKKSLSSGKASIPDSAKKELETYEAALAKQAEYDQNLLDARGFFEHNRQEIIRLESELIEQQRQLGKANADKLFNQRRIDAVHALAQYHATMLAAHPELKFNMVSVEHLALRLERSDETGPLYRSVFNETITDLRGGTNE